MRVISIICAFILCAWFICNPVEAQEVKIEPLPDPVLLAPLPDRRGYSTLPGWSAGYRFDFNLDTKDLSKLRLFMKNWLNCLGKKRKVLKLQKNPKALLKLCLWVCLVLEKLQLLES